MITCPNCLKKHENGTKVCDECGYDLLFATQKQSHNHNANEADTSTEHVIAESEPDIDGVSENEDLSLSKAAEPYIDINDEDDDMPYDAYKYQKEKNPRKIRRFNKIALLRIVCLCLAVIFVVTSVILILNYFFGDKKYPKYVMYVQDGALMYYGIDSNKSLDLSVDVDAIIDMEAYANLCRISDDGSILFYATDYEYGDSSITLSFIDVNARQPKVFDIGYDVIAYSINNDANKVVYLKDDGETSKLFSYAVSSRRRVLIDENVNRFIASDDGTKVVYYETDEALMKVKGNSRTKIADEGYIAWGADQDLYYYVLEETEDGFFQSLYYHNGKKNIRVLDDCAEVVSFVEEFKGAFVAAYTEDGTDIYYVAGGKATKLSLQNPDFFMANHWVSEDGKTLYYLDEPDESLYNDYYDPNAVFEGILYEMTLKKNGCKTAKEIAEDVNGGEFVNGDMFVYRKKTSEADGTYELYHKGSLIDTNVAAIVGAEGKDMVYLKYAEDYQSYELFKDGKAIARNVIYAAIIDGETIYFTRSSGSNDLMNMYKNKKVIAKDIYDVTFYMDKKIAFCTDFSREKGNGEVNLYADGNLTAISEDVYSYSFTLSGDIAFITDVDSQGYGDIYCYANKKIKRIAKEIDADYIGIVDDIGVVSEGNYIDIINVTNN